MRPARGWPSGLTVLRADTGRDDGLLQGQPAEAGLELKAAEAGLELKTAEVGLEVKVDGLMDAATLPPYAISGLAAPSFKLLPGSSV